MRPASDSASVIDSGRAVALEDVDGDEVVVDRAVGDEGRVVDEQAGRTGERHALDLADRLHRDQAEALVELGDRALLHAGPGQGRSVAGDAAGGEARHADRVAGVDVQVEVRRRPRAGR